MSHSKNNAWARIIEEQIEKKFVKTLITRYNEKDDTVLAELANTTLDIVREVKRELESQEPRK